MCQVNKDVVEVDDAETVDLVSQYVVDEMLENGGCVRKSEGHDQIFEQAVASSECSLPFVTL